eukprot:1158680-Pelagomonas_calceolata.AAC.1
MTHTTVPHAWNLTLKVGACLHLQPIPGSSLGVTFSVGFNQQEQVLPCCQGKSRTNHSTKIGWHGDISHLSLGDPRPCYFELWRQRASKPKLVVGPDSSQQVTSQVFCLLFRGIRPARSKAMCRLHETAQGLSLCPCVRNPKWMHRGGGCISPFVVGRKKTTSRPGGSRMHNLLRVVQVHLIVHPGSWARIRSVGMDGQGGLDLLDPLQNILMLGEVRRADCQLASLSWVPSRGALEGMFWGGWVSVSHSRN